MSFPTPQTVKAKPRRFRWWWFYVPLLLLIIAVALAPVASAMYASSIAEAHGCVLNEGSSHPCIVDGKDIGKELYAFGVAGWFMLATVPIGIVMVGIWLVVVIVHRVLWGRANRKQEIKP